MKEIQLTKGKVALVDDDDYEELIKYKWHINKGNTTFYATRHIEKIHKNKILMHRMIMNVPKEMFIDHIDGNGLNNQRSNLRIVTKRQNSQNKHMEKSSKYVGVSFDKDTNKWKASIQINKKIKNIGRFNNEEDAHNAYLKALEEIGEVFVDNINN